MWIWGALCHLFPAMGGSLGLRPSHSGAGHAVEGLSLMVLTRWTVLAHTVLEVEQTFQSTDGTRTMRNRFLLSTLTALIVIGCGSADDQPEGESTADAVRASEADPTAGYYRVYSKAWHCPGIGQPTTAPSCGGTFVRQLNRSSTRCHDGSVGPDCRIAIVDWSETGLTNEELGRYPTGPAKSDAEPVQAIVRGRVVAQDGNDTRLVASELWVAGSAAGVPGGTFVLAKDNGVYCEGVTCPKFNEYELNGATSEARAQVALAQVRLEDAKPERDQLKMAQDLLSYTRAGVIVAGDRYTVTDGDAKGLGRTAKQYFLKAPVPLSW